MVWDSQGREVGLWGTATAVVTATLVLPGHFGNTGQPHLGMMGGRVEFQGLVGVVTDYRYDWRVDDFARVRVTVGGCVPIADAPAGEVRRLVDVEWVECEWGPVDTTPPSPGAVAKSRRPSRILMGKGKGDYKFQSASTTRRIRLQNRGGKG